MDPRQNSMIDKLRGNICNLGLKIMFTSCEKNFENTS